MLHMTLQQWFTRECAGEEEDEKDEKDEKEEKKTVYPRDLPRHSPGVALLCDVGVGCEYKFAGGGAGGPGGG